jgi:hypothetical protein
MAEDLTHTSKSGRDGVVETSAPPASPPGYELIEEVGRGGMELIGFDTPRLALFSSFLAKSSRLSATQQLSSNRVEAISRPMGPTGWQRLR